MKKSILSLAMLLATSSAFSQVFTNGDNGYTQSFGTEGTSCLKNIGGTAGYQFPGGNVSSVAGTANEITVTANATLNTSAGYDSPALLDFYYTNDPNCVSMRGDAVGVDISSTGGAPQLIVRAKASVDGVTVQFHVGSSPDGNYPSQTTASLLVPTGQTEKTLTTSYVDYIVDFSSSQWDAAPVSTRKDLINMWGIMFLQTNSTNAGASVMIESLKIGTTTTGTSSATVVNDQVSLFPNPANGSFNVDITAMNVESASVKVMNANGTVVKELTASDVTSVSTEGLTKGIYMVQVLSGNKIANKKVVVQ